MRATAFDGDTNLPIGADVYTADGQRIGFLTRGDAHELEIGDGFLFISTYTVPVAWVDRYEKGHLVLRLSAEQFEERFRG